MRVRPGYDLMRAIGGYCSLKSNGGRRPLPYNQEIISGGHLEGLYRRHERGDR